MYLQCKYIVSKINYYANFSRAWPYKFLIERPARPFCQIFYIMNMLVVNTRTRYRMKALARKRHPSDGPSHRNVLEAKTHTARELRFDALWTSSLRPFHRSRRWHCPQPEKHLLSQDAVETLLDGPVAKGVQKFRTPSGYTLSRTL